MAAKRDETANATDLGLDLFGQAPADAGMSLEDLGRELAGEDDRPLPYREPAPADDPADSPAESLPVTQEIEQLVAQDPFDERCDVSPRSILEAMLFVGHPQGLPLTSRHVAALMRGVLPQEIDELVRELNDEYARQDTAYVIVSEGEGYRLVLRDKCRWLRERFYGRVKEAKLTQAAVDVLSVVAFHQPITQEQVDELRGRSSGAILGQLVRRQLLRIERTTERPRKTFYRTTDRFLQLFGLSSLDDLPRPQDLS